jgi:hypothetical protein
VTKGVLISERMASLMLLMSSNAFAPSLSNGRVGCLGIFGLPTIQGLLTDVSDVVR